MRSKTFLIAALAAVAAVAVPAVAQAPQIILEVNSKVIPNKAGTKKKPQAVKIAFDAHLDYSQFGDGEKPIVQKVVAYFPKGSLYQGHKFPKCSENTLNRKGPKGCPKASIMGKGTGDAFADTVITHPDITVVNGGKDRVYFYTILNNPARVQTPVVGKISKQRGKWAYKLVAEVPRSLQIVAGVPIVLRDLTVTAGSTTKPWLATTSCPKNKKWAYMSEMYHEDGTVSTYEGSTPCR